jgi:adenylyltransferase/sulfurtransferase
VQIRPASGTSFPYDTVVARLRGSLELTENPYLTRFRVGDLNVHLFRDGRAIVSGTDDPARARAIYARFVG